jgi:multiple sugar transport system permease protein
MGRVLRHVVLFILAAIWILPLYLFLINASKSTEAFRSTERYAPSSDFALFDNISTAWNVAKLGAAVGSTAFYAVFGAALAVALSAMVGYGIVSLKVKWGFFWFLLIYAGTIFPAQMYLSPLYSMYVNNNLYNTHWGLLIFYTAIAIPFATFIIRNHFVSVSPELGEAARLDGASALRVLVQIFAPLSVNAFATVFILQFTWIWNDLLFGLTLSRSENIRPIMTALASLQGQYASSGPQVALAGALIVSIPTFVLFFAVQRVFVRGLRATA